MMPRLQAACQPSASDIGADLGHQGPQPGVAVDLGGRHVQQRFATTPKLLEGLAALNGAFTPVDRLYQAELLFGTFHEPSLYVPGVFCTVRATERRPVTSLAAADRLLSSGAASALAERVSKAAERLIGVSAGCVEVVPIRSLGQRDPFPATTDDQTGE